MTGVCSGVGGIRRTEREARNRSRGLRANGVSRNEGNFILRKEG